MLQAILQKVLFIDSKDYHLDEENSMTIHPHCLPLANLFEKDSFDKVIIANTSADNLKALGFFNVCRALKENGICEVYVDQPIIVMQNLEASEIEANAKLGGFVDVKTSRFEKWVKEGKIDTKRETVKLSMIKISKKDK